MFGASGEAINAKISLMAGGAAATRVLDELSWGASDERSKICQVQVRGRAEKERYTQRR